MIFMAGLLMSVHCALGPCVQVYTDPATHQLIISANQNRAGRTIAPHPRPVKPYRPRPVSKPKPRPWIPYKAVPIVHRAYKPPVKKRSTITKVVTTALALSDQITRLLPGSKIFYQPKSEAVTGIPVYLWCDTSTLFQVATAILGVGVTVEMNPTFLWDFGDGTKLSTTNPGGPYPDSSITHTYQRAGIYTITLTTSWAGSWATQGALLPVLGGAIVQNTSATIVLSPGPTDFTR